MADWDDIRFFLAVMRSGTTLAASAALRVSQTTVARRIEALEASLDLKLFERRRSGYRPTEAARALEQAAAEAEAATLRFMAAAQERKRAVTGTVRLTTNELFADLFLVGLIAEFRALHPGVKIEIVTTDRSLDLAAGEADIALRATMRPTQASLVGRRLGDDPWSVYCSRGYEQLNGVPRSEADLSQHSVIGIERGDFGGPVATWLGNQLPEAAVVLRRNSPQGLFAAVKAGLGVSLVPEVVAATDPDLVHCFTPPIEQPYEIWLLTHERLRDEPRVRAAMDFFAERLQARLRTTARTAPA